MELGSVLCSSFFLFWPDCFNISGRCGRHHAVFLLFTFLSSSRGFGVEWDERADE